MSKDRLAEIKRQLSLITANPLRDNIDRELIAEIERLQVINAELRDLLKQGWNNERSDPRSRRELTEKVHAVLQRR